MTESKEILLRDFSLACTRSTSLAAILPYLCLYVLTIILRFAKAAIL